jgi:orotidine-5'-phosphate decarboxylase
MADSFAARFAAVRAVHGPLVFGLDPSAEVLESWGLGDTADGLDRFADIVLAAVQGQVGLVKPQSAFYERHGWRGIKTLQRLIADARSAGAAGDCRRQARRRRLDQRRLR